MQYHIDIIDLSTYETLCDRFGDATDIETEVRKALWDSKGHERPIRIKIDVEYYSRAGQ